MGHLMDQSLSDQHTFDAVKLGTDERGERHVLESAKVICSPLPKSNRTEVHLVSPRGRVWVGISHFQASPLRLELCARPLACCHHLFDLILGSTPRICIDPCIDPSVCDYHHPSLRWVGNQLTHCISIQCIHARKDQERVVAIDIGEIPVVPEGIA